MNANDQARRQGMSTEPKLRIPIRRSLRLALAIALLVAGAALADRMVDANEPVVISDDINNHVTNVISTTGGPG